MFASTPDRIRHLAWLPAAMLIAWGILAAAGLPLTPDSRAATSSGSSTVGADVQPEIHISMASCGTAGNLGSSVSLAASSDDTPIGSGDCTVSFGTNNGNSPGASLTVASARASGSSMCKTAATLACPGSPTPFADVNTTTGTATLSDGQFGMQVSAATCTSRPNWATNSNFYGLANSASPVSICVRAAGSDGSVTFRPTVDPAGTQEAGTYQTQADFVASAS